MPYQIILCQKQFFLVNLSNLHMLYHAENRHLLVHFYRFIWSILGFFSNFCILVIFFLCVNNPQALSVNAGCLKCISNMNLSLANKNLLIILFTLYTKNKLSPNNDIFLKVALIPNWLNSPQASRSWWIWTFYYHTLHTWTTAWFSLFLFF